MKASFAATHPLTTIKRFVAVYSDDHSRSPRPRRAAPVRLPRRHGDGALPDTETKDVTKPVAVWTSVVSCRTAAQALRFARAERKDVNREWTKPPTAATVRAQRCHALPHGALAAVAATKLLGGGKASLTIVLVPRGQNVAVLTLTSQTGSTPIRKREPDAPHARPEPIAAPRRSRRPPPLGVPVEAARFVRRLTVRAGTGSTSSRPSWRP